MKDKKTQVIVFIIVLAIAATAYYFYNKSKNVALTASEKEQQALDLRRFNREIQAWEIKIKKARSEKVEGWEGWFIRDMVKRAKKSTPEAIEQDALYEQQQAVIRGTTKYPKGWAIVNNGEKYEFIQL